MKIPLIDALISRGYESPEARALILAGRVLVNEVRESRAGFKVPADAAIRVQGERKYVSRAAYKLLGALKTFQPDLTDRICLDLGASHGGFTQVLLEAGAAKVYAVDVAYGIFDFKLRQDPRVQVLERHNARLMETTWFSSEDLDNESGLFCTADLSFISLRSILQPLSELSERLRGPLQALLLVKPQFESSQDTEQGIMRDEGKIQSILEELKATALGLGFHVLGLEKAELKGAQGNQEYVLFLELL